MRLCMIVGTYDEWDIDREVDDVMEDDREVRARLEK